MNKYAIKNTTTATKAINILFLFKKLVLLVAAHIYRVIVFYHISIVISTFFYALTIIDIQGQKRGVVSLILNK